MVYSAPHTPRKRLKRRAVFLVEAVCATVVVAGTWAGLTKIMLDAHSAQKASRECWQQSWEGERARQVIREFLMRLLPKGAIRAKDYPHDPSSMWTNPQGTELIGLYKPPTSQARILGPIALGRLFIDQAGRLVLLSKSLDRAPNADQPSERISVLFERARALKFEFIPPTGPPPNNQPVLCWDQNIPYTPDMCRIRVEMQPGKDWEAHFVFDAEVQRLDCDEGTR